MGFDEFLEIRHRLFAGSVRRMSDDDPFIKAEDVQHEKDVLALISMIIFLRSELEKEKQARAIREKAESLNSLPKNENIRI